MEVVAPYFPRAANGAGHTAVYPVHPLLGASVLVVAVLVVVVTLVVVTLLVAVRLVTMVLLDAVV